MTDASLPAAHFTEGDFRIGRILGPTSSVFSRNFLNFFVVTAIASLPMLLLLKGADGTGDNPLRTLQLVGLGLFLGIVLSTLSQAIVLDGAFQDMRGSPVDLRESVR